MSIQVKMKRKEDPMLFEVEVKDKRGATRHQVTLSRAEFDRLSGGAFPPERFIEAAFAFLLEREPKEAILTRFDVSVISRYFPDFPRRIGDYLRS